MVRTPVLVEIDKHGMEPVASNGHREFPRLVIENTDRTAASYSQKRFVGWQGPGCSAAPRSHLAKSANDAPRTPFHDKLACLSG
jgi:hypothetical protein